MVYTPAQYRFAKRLLELYDRYPRFRNAFLRLIKDEKKTYRGYNLKFYLRMVVDTAPQLYQRYGRNFKNAEKSLGDPKNDIFILFHRTPAEFQKLDLIPLYQTTDPEMQRLENTPDRELRSRSIFQFLAKKEAEEIRVGGIPLQSIPSRAGATASNIISSSVAKNILSLAQIQVKRLASRYLTIERAGAIFSGVVGGVVGFGMGGPVGAAAGATFGGLALPRLAPSILGGASVAGAGGAKLVAGAVNPVVAGALLANQLRRSRLPQYALAAFLAFMLFVVKPGGFGEKNALVFNTDIAESAPLETSVAPGTLATLDYTIPIRDTSITPLMTEEIKNQVRGLPFCQGGSPRLELWPKLIEESRKAGWNPAFISALWIEETGAQCNVPYDNAIGCGNDPNKNSLDAQSRLFDYSLPCMNSFINSWFPNKTYSDSNFGEFMCLYGPGTRSCNFSSHPNFPPNVKIWYQRLAPGSIRQTPVPPPTVQDFALSCPVPDGKIVSSSFFDNSYPYQHCRADKGFVSMDACVADPTLKWGNDIGHTRQSTSNTQNFATIPYLLTQSGITESLSCTRLDSYVSNPPAVAEQQWIAPYRCSSTSNNNLYLQFHHIRGSAPPPQNLISGQRVGEIANYSSSLRLLNIQIGVGGNCGQGNTTICVRAEEYLRCPKL